MSEEFAIDYIAEARKKRKAGQGIFRYQSVDQILDQAEKIKFENIALRAELDILRSDKVDIAAVMAQNATLDKVMGELAEANRLQEIMTAERDSAIDEIHALNENLNIAFKRIIQFKNELAAAHAGIVPFHALTSEVRRIASFHALTSEVRRIAVEHGWWETDRNDGEMIALMHSELSEALEALRHGNPPSDHIPEFSGVEEEMADVIIRVLDYAAARNLRIWEAVKAKMAFNETRPIRHGGKLF